MTATKADIQRLIECCICCDYLTEVRETPCCHQLFCYSCIQSWLQKTAKACPKCRSTTLTEQSLLRNIVIERFVDNLQFDCPNALQGCSVKVSKCDLIKHKRLCSYTPEKLAQKHRLKLEESRNLLTKYKEGKMQITDNILYDLAQLFYTEHEYIHAKECLQFIKEKPNSQELIILQAHIERETNQYDKALELYTKAYSLANSIPQRIELLESKGQLLLKKAQYEQAKDAFTQALDLLRSNDTSQTKAKILNALGLIAKKCSDVSSKKKDFIRIMISIFFQYDQAILSYNEALQIVDTHSNLWSDIISNLAGIY
jgi:Tfp pilus assembly protein PilF